MPRDQGHRKAGEAEQFRREQWRRQGSAASSAEKTRRLGQRKAQRFVASVSECC